MKALEIARAYYGQYGAPMLEEQFPELLPHVAAGLFGSGSECFGFDDDISRDHDLEPGFCLFLPGEDVIDRRSAFLLERAYAKLPREFMGLRRGLVAPAGGPRKGVLRTQEFFLARTGTPDGCLDSRAWLALPDWALAECVNGAVFRDDAGEVTAIRERLSFYPEDVRRKKLAGRLLLMGQAGQYNCPRCLRRGERGAAALAAAEFVKNGLNAVFLLNRVYEPFYKWSFRALRELPVLSELAGPLEAILSGGDERARQDMIEAAASAVIAELRRQGLTASGSGDLEDHAGSVNDGVSDPSLRTLHVLAGV